MDASDLRPEQLKRMSEALRPTTAYLLRLQQRMTATGFPSNDPLSQKVGEALKALRSVAMELHHRQYPKNAAKTEDLGPKTH